MTEASGRHGSNGLHLNGATIMSTPTDRHIEIARATGYAGVEVRAERLLDAPGELRRAASIVRPGEVWSLNGIQVRLRSNGALDDEVLDLELAPRLEICQALGAAYLLIVAPRIPGVGVSTALPSVREGVRRIAERAAAASIQVAFEFLGFADCPIDSPQLAAAVVEGVPGTDLVIDSCHWHAGGGAPLGGFPVDRVAMVHLNDAPAMPPREIEDADRLLPGLGVIHLRDLIADLRSGGYAGPWSLETFNPGYWLRDAAAVAREGRAATMALLGYVGTAKNRRPTQSTGP